MLSARSRPLFVLGFVACTAALAVAIYLEAETGLVPCSLSLVQRFFMGLMALSCLASVIHCPGRKGMLAYAGGNLLFSMLGGLAATRHVWMQEHADQPKIVCQPGFDYLLQALPLKDVLTTLAMGTPECARVNWTLLDMSLAEWSLFAFVGMLVLSLWTLLQSAR
ncbi:MAG: disulfide bond formation protein B [Pseudomonas sp.]|nr:disulfide bond formation protein B [Pseudomonas sp.]